jgi:hypothetical protein
MNRAQRRAAARGVDPKDVEQQQLQKIAAPGTPQDVTSERAKSQRHGKVTADKWNQ